MDGIILINKPKGCTSHDIVYKVKKILNEKVGHTGTLDPMATGVLPLLIGKGTLCSKYLINHDKKYQVTLELGKKTITADAEGEIIEEKQVDEKIFDNQYLTDILKSFIGKQEQIPPMYSAIKVNGKKLYEYARKGQEVEIKPRQIEIYDIKILNINEKLKQISFEVSCSKGTYIRSLCEDIAKAIDTVGFMKELKRIQVGDFKIENTTTIEELENNISFITIEKLFEKKSQIELDNKKLSLFLNGLKLTYNIPDGIYRIYNNNSFIGIGIVEKNLLKRDIVLTIN
ncbi:MAG: tRNA pseudouridine(55) synthase TruB [Clostridia bacterium]|nr:tRNA pseudouridine(55) synthase TruB [Clostridia bacterium]